MQTGAYLTDNRMVGFEAYDLYTALKLRERTLDEHNTLMYISSAPAGSRRTPEWA